MLVLELVLIVVLVNGIADDFSEMKVKVQCMNSKIYIILNHSKSRRIKIRKNTHLVHTDNELLNT